MGLEEDKRICAFCIEKDLSLSSLDVYIIEMSSKIVSNFLKSS